MIREILATRNYLTRLTDCFTYFKENIISSLGAGLNHLPRRSTHTEKGLRRLSFSTVLLEQSVPPPPLLICCAGPKPPTIYNVKHMAGVYKTWIRLMLNLSLTRYWWEQHLNQTDPLCSARLTSASPPPPPRLLLQSDSFTMKDSGAFRFYSDVVCFYLDLIFDRLWKGKELFFFFVQTSVQACLKPVFCELNSRPRIKKNFLKRHYHPVAARVCEVTIWNITALHL